jgi:hypothetical protein
MNDCSIPRRTQLAHRRSLAIEELLIQQAEQHLLTDPLLLYRRPDPLRGQYEAIVTGVREFNGERKLGTTDSVHVIDRRAGSRVLDVDTMSAYVSHSFRTSGTRTMVAPLGPKV